MLSANRFCIFKTKQKLTNYLKHNVENCIQNTMFFFSFIRGKLVEAEHNNKKTDRRLKCSGTCFLRAVVSIYVCVHPRQMNLSPSGCWNMNAWCKISAIPLAALQSFQNKLWQGNSGIIHLHEMPFLLCVIWSRKWQDTDNTTHRDGTKFDSVNLQQINIHCGEILTPFFVSVVVFSFLKIFKQSQILKNILGKL